MLRTFLRWPAFFTIFCWIVLTGAHAEPHVVKNLKRIEKAWFPVS
jgi:hypothetical protein